MMMIIPLIGNIRLEHDYHKVFLRPKSQKQLNLSDIKYNIMQDRNTSKIVKNDYFKAIGMNNTNVYM